MLFYFLFSGNTLTLLHMSRQLFCRCMYRMMTWSGHAIFSKSNRCLDKRFIMRLNITSFGEFLHSHDPFLLFPGLQFSYEYSRIIIGTLVVQLRRSSHRLASTMAFDIVLTQIWGVQIIEYIMAQWSYSFVCTSHYLIIITMQTYLKVLNF